MGKIYDALKRAEEKAQTKREEKTYAISPASLHGISQPETDNEHNKIEPEYNNIEQPKVIKQPESKLFKPFSIPSNEVLEDFDDKKSFLRLFSFNFFKRRNAKATQEGTGNLFSLDAEDSLIAEQYKTLRTRILSVCKERKIKTLLITSCLSGEGKSTVASNLSICVAKGINQHAMLIDCDLRKPSINKFFRINSNLGLSNYLSHDISLSQIVNTTMLDQLDIVTAGTITDKPSELLSSERFLDFLSSLKSTYSNSYCILDSSPVCQTPEPLVISKYVDGIILVVKAGSTNRDLLIKAVDGLGRNKIIGLVFNMNKEQSKSNSYNYYYYPKK